MSSSLLQQKFVLLGLFGLLLGGCGVSGRRDSGVMMGSSVGSSEGDVSRGMGGPGDTPIFFRAPASQGTGCHSASADQRCLALKYVVYNDAEGNPVVSLDQAKQNLARINELWNPCSIHFELAQYLPVDPLQYHLQFRPADDSELDDIRGAFMVQDKLLVVTTGKWDRSGSLGNTGANAWTSMPGERFYGAVLESEVGTFSNIIAHELGHYMSLDHVRDSSDLMNPIIYDESIYLSKKQCRYALSTVEDFWKSTLR